MQSLLVDSSIYIFRSYFTLPENWHAPESQLPTHAVYGFTSFMLDLLKQKQPDYIFCAFDESLRTGFRHQLCADYKANRELPDAALAFQLNACRQLCRVLGVAEMASDIYEADDLIGSMASTMRGAGVQPIIVSRDKDLMQLVRDQDLYCIQMVGWTRPCGGWLGLVFIEVGTWFVLYYVIVGDTRLGFRVVVCLVVFIVRMCYFVLSKTYARSV